MNNSKNGEIKSNTEQFNENSEKSRLKKKKNKFKKNQQSFFKSGQVKETNLRPCNSVQMDHTNGSSLNELIHNKEWRKKKESKKFGNFSIRSAQCRNINLKIVYFR